MNESRKYACCLAFPNRTDRRSLEIGFFLLGETRMKEHGLYIIKNEFLELINSFGGQCNYTVGEKRPVYCCIKDNRIEGLYWAIPSSDLSHRSAEQIANYKKYMELPENDLRSSYYHIGKTTKEALYKISSCYPVTDKYIDHENTSCGKHVVIKRAETVKALEKS